MKINQAVLFSVGIFLCIASGFTSLRPALGRSRTQPESQPPAKHFAEVKLPHGYHPPSARCHQFKGRDIAVDLFAGTIAQGMTIYAEIYRDPAAQDRKIEVKKFYIDAREIALSKRTWGYRALFGIHPETVPRMRNIQIVYSINGQAKTENFTLPVSRTGYQFNPRALDLGKYSDVDYRPTPEEIAFINRCSAKKNMVFGRTGPDRLGAAYSHPRNSHFITSPFWSKRLIMQYRKKNGKKIRLKDKINVHKGIDLRGNTGDPVFSMADGMVVIAEPMYYEGNFIVIDHGNRIFTYYMHLNEFNVKEGDLVKAGQQVGRVGSTGLSTAAHLHVSLMIQDVSVDPLSILMLPVRN